MNAETEEVVEMSADEVPAAKKVTAAPVEKKQDMVQVQQEGWRLHTSISCVK